MAYVSAILIRSIMDRFAKIVMQPVKTAQGRAATAAHHVMLMRHL
jgi:hypothetical protein